MTPSPAAPGCPAGGPPASAAPPGGPRVAVPPSSSDFHGLLPNYECGDLMTDKHKLELLVDRGELRMIDAADAEWNIQHHAQECHRGGEAVVHIVEWHNRGSAPSTGWPIAEGRRVALKVHRCPSSTGGSKKACHQDPAADEANMALCTQRKEVNMLHILRRIGCADHIPELLGAFQREGSAQEPPLYGYAMPAYDHGSLANYLRRTCAGLGNDFASFFGGAKMAAHYSKLHDVLRRLSCAEVCTRPADEALPRAEWEPVSPWCPGLLLQDITSNNLLLKETAEGCQLLFADPSRAEPVDALSRFQRARWRNIGKRDFLTATWVWGSLAARRYRLDKRADVFSLNMCMLEMWAVAEGTPMTLTQLFKTMCPGYHMETGVTFMRALCTAMLKQHAMCGSACGIVPRIKRELPLSWLMLWAILLGCDDFHSQEELDTWRPHRRPSAADMADVAARLAEVADQMEGLEGGVSAAALEAPAGASLVQQCVQLYNRLAALTRLDDPDLLPTDSSLRWVATHFLQQEHPLVAAMNRQGDLVVGPGYRCTIPKVEDMWCFDMAVMEAQREAKWESGQQVLDRCGPMMVEMCQEYRQLQLKVLRLASPGSELAQLVLARDAKLPRGMKQFMHANSDEYLQPLPWKHTRARNAPAQPQAAGGTADNVVQSRPLDAPPRDPLLIALEEGLTLPFFSRMPLPWGRGAPAIRFGAPSPPPVPAPAAPVQPQASLPPPPQQGAQKLQPPASVGTSADALQAQHGPAATAAVAVPQHRAHTEGAGSAGAPAAGPGQFESPTKKRRLFQDDPSVPPAAASAASPGGSLLAASGSQRLSSEGRRMALALAGGQRLQPDPNNYCCKADVERYADALELLITSQQPPAGLEAQHALFRPIDTAAKLAWFLGWWASNDHKAPDIPGLDMECSNNAKAAWTRAVLDAAEEGGKFNGSVTAAHSATMPYVAHALLHRLLVRRPLFAAAVDKEMQEI